MAVCRSAHIVRRTIYPGERRRRQKAIPYKRTSSMNTNFTFSAGVWNLNTGADPFGPAVRQEKEFAEKCRTFKRLGFDFVQLHDDDAVPMDVSPNLVGFYANKL